ncbi:hypothetical protein FRC06_003245 [Ceratobasidium sp. 370]|nr:hypothetical protein FRC06_003245 [Ceratobasidium sp. 370]
MAGTATDAPTARPLQYVTTVSVSESEVVARDARIEAGKAAALGGGGGGGNNPGNNLHVSGLSSRVDNRMLEETFGKFGKASVAKASVVYDPHTRDSRGFAFVTMDTVEEAEAAITGLHNTDLAGKPMTVEKARRGRARTPTPGKYLGTARRDDRVYDRGYERPYYPREYDSRYASRDDRRGYDDRRDDRYGRYDDRRRYDDGRGRYDDGRGRYEEGRGRYAEERGGRGGGGGGYEERRYDDRR